MLQAFMKNSCISNLLPNLRKFGRYGIILLFIVFSQIGLAEEDTSRNALAVYLPDYRVKSGQEVPQLHGTSDLILFSAKPGEEGDGGVDFSRITPALLSFAEKARASAPDLRVSVCVGGWGRGKEFARAVSSPENRERFVVDLAAFCAEHQLDGVDIDWEFPKGDEEHAHFALFLESLSARLHRDGRQLTAALGYTRPLSRECWTYLDRVHLMSYQPWSVQPYEPWLRESIERFLAAGLPPEKLLLGVGFYAKEKAGERRAVSWKRLVEENSPGLPASDHGFWPVGTETCDLRVRLVKEYGLGGVMVWDYGHDSPEPETSLLRYLTSGLRQAAGPE